MVVDEATLEMIVERVLAALAARTAPAVPRRQVLALFSGAGSGYLAGMAAVHELTEAGHKLTAVLSPAAAQLIGADRVKAAGASAIVEPGQWVCAPEMVEKSDLILVPTLSMNLAARLAAGLMDSLVATLIIGGLLAGKPVLALRDGADPYGQGGQVFGNGEGAATLRTRLAENLQTVAAYGVTLVGEAQFLPAMRAALDGEKAAPGLAGNGHGQHPPGAKLVAPSPPPPTGQSNGRQRHFVTETDLLSLAPRATVRLSEACRLTPLAQDTARRMNLNLVYE